MTLSVVCTISAIDEFGAAVMEFTPAAFSEKGFTFGDTVDLTFSNGVHIENVPYFNGFYVSIGDPVIVAYPGFDHPTINYNCLNFSRKTGVCCGDTVKVTMKEKGGKREIMDLRGVVYSNDPGDYPSRDAFANAREFRAGRIAAGKLYRCASPFDHTMNRPEAVDEFLREHQVRTTFSISESEETLRQRYAKMPPYAKQLYENGHVIPLGLGSGYFADEFRAGITGGLITAMGHSLPWAIHCLEGKDRTGFVCILLGALMGADRQELTDDFMKTFENYYGINQSSDPFRYNGFRSTFIDNYLQKFAELGENEDPQGQDYSKGAAVYLRGGGMTDGQIEQLQQLLASQSREI